MKQLPLGIAFPKSATFDSFFGSGNTQVIEALQRCVAGSENRPIYIHGPVGGGKTHLMHATCNAVAERGGRPFYLTFDTADPLAPDMLSGLEALDLIALDDLHRIAGRETWEQALFGLFNAIFDAGKPLLLSANAGPDQLGIALPDLKSRIGWSTVYRLEELADQEKIGALQVQAQRRGLELNEEVGRFLLSRVRRDMGSLLAVLDRLDDASLVAKRRLTVPFVREVLNR